MASREEERGTRAAARTATGARPTRGDLWAAIFEQGREARVRRLWATFGPTTVNDTTTLETRAA